MLPALIILSAGLLFLVTPILAQLRLPYNPTRVVPTKNGSIVYVFTPQLSSTQFTVSWFNTSAIFNSSSKSTTPFNTLPFLSNSDSKAFTTLPDEEGISVLVGDCKSSIQDLALWRFTYDTDFRSGVWQSLILTTTDASLSANFLSAGFTFSPTNSLENISLYVFGGMCPDDASLDANDWISDSTYSNTVLTVASDPGSNNDSPYQLSLTGSRAPPIPEAGLTITPLTPTFSNTSDTSVAQQQNFVLLGGHTQDAFINMSQLAIFSLPQQSWAFVEASQPSSSIQPRSGHTAVLTDDGSRIVVFGGWVGDISTPAEPQLIVLEIAQDYGGRGNWAWTSPFAVASPVAAGQGVYGHGAAMLPGGVMMVVGGYSTGSSGPNSKRDVLETLLFLNTTSFEWTGAYTNPNAASTSGTATSAGSSASGLKFSEKAGIGAGLGLGLVAVAVVVIFWLLYAQRLGARRALREKELRDLALGAGRHHSPHPLGEDDDQRFPGVRSASWGAAQERSIESSGDPFPWAPIIMAGQNENQRSTNTNNEDNSARYAERSGVQMEIPSPTRGLRKNLNTRGPLTYHPLNQNPPVGPGTVFRIEEEDEGSHSGSLRRTKNFRAADDNKSVSSDPFKDPLPTATGAPQIDAAAARRKKEVEEWVDDWQSVAESMSVSRSTSQAHSRTYSNLSQFRGPTVGVTAGRGSPEKSDRTGSNLSEKSMMSTSSFQRSVAGTLSRNVSQRSASAGHALFSGAAAAIRGFGYGRQGNAARDVDAGLTRFPSNRSVSLNIDTTPNTASQDGADIFSSARGKWGPAMPGENQSLLNRGYQSPKSEDRDYRTLPESPGKEKYSRGESLSGSGRKALNLLGSVRRVLTGTGSVDVQDRVAGFEGQSAQSSPTKHSEMSEATPKRTLSGGTTLFWRGKRGARDWEDDLPSSGNDGPSSTIRRKPIPGVTKDNNGENEEDWDVETAVQQRVVQVMFTVPKEKLRVVNADALSLLSSNRSEVDLDEDKERDQVKRMSSVREGEEDYYEYDQADDDTMRGKGKGPAL